MRVIQALVLTPLALEAGNGSTVPTGWFARVTLSQDAAASTSARSDIGSDSAPRCATLAAAASCLVTYAPPTASALVIARAKSTIGIATPRFIGSFEGRR